MPVQRNRLSSGVRRQLLRKWVLLTRPLSTSRWELKSGPKGYQPGASLLPVQGSFAAPIDSALIKVFARIFFAVLPLCCSCVAKNGFFYAYVALGRMLVGDAVKQSGQLKGDPLSRALSADGQTITQAVGELSIAETVQARS